jgi:hypothetical protein
MNKMKYNILNLLITVLLFSGFANQLIAQNGSARKSIFLTDAEKTRLLHAPSTSPTASLLSAMQARVNMRALSPGLVDPTATNEWWHLAGEYLTDAALIHAVRPSAQVDAWLRASVLDIVQRSIAEWSGPPFRSYGGGEMVGNLETAHLTWGIGIAYDLASDLFSLEERTEIFSNLREKGMLPCQRFIEKTNLFHNWNCVLYAGFTVAAAVLGDEKALAYAAEWLPVAEDHFQNDGSYGESLQYANYAAYSIMLAHEALIRKSSLKTTTFEPYARIVNWASYALFYRKPLSGWPIMDWPRSANFGDCAAIFRPSGDLLIHIAARARKELPLQAGLASWLFNTLYFPANEPGPHDLASFGFVNGFGFLSVIMLADAAPAISPVEANLPVTTSFSGGDAFARDAWDGITTLATRTPSEPRHASAHLHGDINSFILVHNKERLLLDPGHSCYRNITHEIEISTSSHNTCTFEIPFSASSPAGNLAIPSIANEPGRTMVQHVGKRRSLIHENGKMSGGDPGDDGGRRLITSRLGSVSVIGSDAAQLYGAPLKTFSRFWVLCGSYALFIVDRIESDVPVRTTWNWLLNNRDGLLDYKMERPNKLIVRRGDAGVKITSFGSGNYSVPIYAMVHDAYHPLPNQRGEGKPGSGILMRWTENAPSLSRTVVHTLAIDSHAGISGWESKGENNNYTLEDLDRKQKWSLQTNDDGSFSIEDNASGQSYIVTNSGGVWSLSSKNTIGKK